MRRLPIKEGYISADGEVIIYFSGTYKIIDTDYQLFFIANKEAIIYDTLLVPPEAVTFTNRKLSIKSDITETFYKLGGK